MRIRSVSGQPPGRREQATELRARAAAIRAQFDGQECALADRRQADEDRELDAQADALELEQRRDERRADLLAKAEEADAAALELDLQVAELDRQLFGDSARAAQYRTEVAATLAERRETLEETLAELTATGGVDAMLKAQGEPDRVPAVEQRLMVQADDAAWAVVELNDQAIAVEQQAASARQRARALRHWAETEPLRETPPPVAVAAYRERLRELPRCHELATSDAFGIVETRLYPDRFATDVSEAATAALDELGGEPLALGGIHEPPEHSSEANTPG